MSIDSIRADYRVVRKWWREVKGWSEIDIAEADSAIKAAIEGSDQGRVDCWANWLGALAIDARCELKQKAEE